MARQPVVYILASPNGRALYIGVTTDLGRRLDEHRRGTSIHTTHYNITRLVYIESHENTLDAIEREKQLKRWRREKKIALIDAANPEWLDLSSEVLEDQEFVAVNGCNEMIFVEPPCETFCG